VLEAGVDQFGGEVCTELVIELVESGQVSMERIDQSCRRILRDKFRQGLFDNPYLDINDTLQIAGNPEFRAAGEIAATPPRLSHSTTTPTCCPCANASRCMSKG
jgi:beta-glucosidase